MKERSDVGKLYFDWVRKAINFKAPKLRHILDIYIVDALARGL